MRETFSSLILASQNYISDASTSRTSDTSLSDTQTLIKSETNKTTRGLFKMLPSHLTEESRTAATVEDQQYYHLPPNFGSFEAATLTISSIAYPLIIVNSYQHWNEINQIDFSGSIIPKYIFPRRDDFGLWPIPTADDDTITFVYHMVQKDMVNVDYDTGTVSSTQNDETIAGSGTTFTSGMVGRWFKADTDGDWYRVDAYTSATSIELESAFEGSAVSGDTYIIGESPELPIELHEYIPYRVAATFFAGPKRDMKKAQAFLNMYWTGDFDNPIRTPSRVHGGVLAAMKRYKLGRSESRLVNKPAGYDYRFNEAWSATLS